MFLFHWMWNWCEFELVSTLLCLTWCHKNWDFDIFSFAHMNEPVHEYFTLDQISVQERLQVIKQHHSQVGNTHCPSTVEFLCNTHTCSYFLPSNSNYWATCSFVLKSGTVKAFHQQSLSCQHISSHLIEFGSVRWRALSSKNLVVTAAVIASKRLLGLILFHLPSKKERKNCYTIMCTVQTRV